LPPSLSFFDNIAAVTVWQLADEKQQILYIQWLEIILGFGTAIAILFSVRTSETTTSIYQQAPRGREQA
jgi:hypothetical protein